MLNDFRKSVLEFITREIVAAKQRFHNGENVAKDINIAAGYAFALYRDLTSAGHPIQFSETMLTNRCVPTTDPEFFRQLHLLKDFVTLVGRIV